LTVWITKKGETSRFFLDIAIVTKKAVVQGTFNLMKSAAQNSENIRVS